MPVSWWIALRVLFRCALFFQTCRRGITQISQQLTSECLKTKFMTFMVRWIYWSRDLTSMMNWCSFKVVTFTLCRCCGEFMVELYAIRRLYYLNFDLKKSVWDHCHTEDRSLQCVYVSRSYFKYDGTIDQSNINKTATGRNLTTISCCMSKDMSHDLSSGSSDASEL